MHISFSEILVILLVALLVIKPERLPEAATTLGRWLRGVQAILHKIKKEINPESAKYSYHEDKDV